MRISCHVTHGKPINTRHGDGGIKPVAISDPLVHSEQAHGQTPRVKRDRKKMRRFSAIPLGLAWFQVPSASCRRGVPKQVQMPVFLVAVTVRVVIELRAVTHVDQVIGRVVLKLQYLVTSDPVLAQGPMRRCGGRKCRNTDTRVPLRQADLRIGSSAPMPSEKYRSCHGSKKIELGDQLITWKQRR